MSDLVGFLAIFMIFTGMAVFLFKKGYDNLKFLRNCSRTRGVVIDLEWDRNNAIPIFGFTDQRNRKFTVRASISRTPMSSPYLGKKVDVLYDPENPHRAEIGGDVRLFTTMFFVFSAFCLFFSIAALSVLLSAML